MLYELFETYEELKKYIFIVDRGTKGNIIIKFKNENFFHLVGLQHTNILMFIPNHIKTKDKQYKYLRKHIDKYNKIIENQIIEKYSLQMRMETFSCIKDLLKGEKTFLYDTREKNAGALFDGEFGLFKVYEEIHCFLGLKKNDEINSNVYCVPQTWISDRKAYKKVIGKKPLYINSISKIDKEIYMEKNSLK